MEQPLQNVSFQNPHLHGPGEFVARCPGFKWKFIAYRPFLSNESRCFPPVPFPTEDPMPLRREPEGKPVQRQPDPTTKWVDTSSAPLICLAGLRSPEVTAPRFGSVRNAEDHLSCSFHYPGGYFQHPESGGYYPSVFLRMEYAPSSPFRSPSCVAGGGDCFRVFGRLGRKMEAPGAIARPGPTTEGFTGGSGIPDRPGETA